MSELLAPSSISLHANAISLSLSLCAVQRDRRLVDVGLKDVLAEDIFKEGKAPFRWAEEPGLSGGTRCLSQKNLVMFTFLL